MNQGSLLDFRVTWEEISSVFEPVVCCHFAPDDFRWQRQVFRTWRKQFRDYIKP